MNYLARRVTEEMKKKNIDQLALAAKAGVSQSTINRTLNSGTNTRIGTVVKIAKALGVPPEYLIIEDETKALLCLELSHMDKDTLRQTLLYLEKEKLYKELKKTA